MAYVSCDSVEGEQRDGRKDHFLYMYFIFI